MAEEEKRRWNGKGIGAGKGTAGRTAKKKIPARNAKTESSKRWIERQLSDPYVKKTQAAGYRSRAAFKMIELQEKFDLIRKVTRLLILGRLLVVGFRFHWHLARQKLLALTFWTLNPLLARFC